MKQQDIKVDFANSILALSNSFLHYYGIKTEFPSLMALDEKLKQNYRNIVFLILDCFGKNIIEQHLQPQDFLRTHVAEYISTIYPPTTAAATITFHSGLPPLQSGWIGWMNYFPQYHRIIENFNNIDFYTGEVLSTPAPADTILKYETIYEKIIRHNPDVEYHKIFPSFEPGGVETFAEMCERIAAATESNSKRKIISAYWTEPDHTIHYEGVNSTLVQDCVIDLSNKINNLSAKVKDTLFVISADHGAIDVQEKIINEHADLCATLSLPPAIEARFISFFIKEGCQNNFKKLFTRYYGNDFVLFAKSEFLQSHILGYGKKHQAIEGFIGDFVAVATGNLSLNYDSGKRKLKLFKATHAGYTPEEMTVPLILIECP